MCKHTKRLKCGTIHTIGIDPKFPLKARLGWYIRFKCKKCNKYLLESLTAEALTKYV